MYFVAHVFEYLDALKFVCLFYKMLETFEKMMTFKQNVVC